MSLEEGDIAEIRRDSVQIWDMSGQVVERESVQYRDGAYAQYLSWKHCCCCLPVGTSSTRSSDSRCAAI